MNSQDVGHHVERSGSIRLHSAPDTVFPLFGPDREREWAEGWEPEAVWPGAVMAQEGAVFRTQHGAMEAVWVVSRFDAGERVVEYTTFRHEDRVTRITIQVEADAGHEGWSVAQVTYALTALSGRGAIHMSHFSDEHYREIMQEWERDINAVLARSDS